MDRNLLKTAGDIRTFIFAGNATITLVSKTSGTRFTYRIRAADTGNVHFVSLLNGADNENSYQYLGLFRVGIYRHGWKSSKISEDAPSAKAFEWFARNVLSAGKLPETLEVWHEGRCGACNRKLTVPQSIKSGIGPECAKRVGIQCLAA